MATLDNSYDDANSHEQESNAPPLTVHIQYLKDVSFENPNPFKSLQNQEDNPEINVNISIRVEKMHERTYEVGLQVTAEAARQSEKIFVAEVDYAGVFTLGDLPEDSEHPVLMIECPRILFPYARQIIANLTREGGYPALSLNPIDFVEMYRQQLQQQQEQQKPN